MVPPIQGQPLLLYLTSTPRSVGALLAQERDGVEKPVYYLSRTIVGPEQRYSPLERHCLALVFVAQKLRHYLLAFSTHVVTRSDPIKYLLARTVLIGRAARWFLILCEYDLKCIVPRAIKSQALADLLAHFPSGTYEPIIDDLPGDDLRACVCAHNEWILQFDGSSAAGKGGAGISLFNNHEKFLYAFKLDFPCSNNEAEYEALALGLLEALGKGVQHLRIQGDSYLVLKQLQGDYGLKHDHLAPLRTAIQRLLRQFHSVKIEKVTRNSNRHPDALATIATKAIIPRHDPSATLTVHKRTVSVSITHAIPIDFKDDWRTTIIEQLKNPAQSKQLAMLKHYVLIQALLYHRCPSGLLARCIDAAEAKYILDEVHKASCQASEIPLYRRIQRMGYFWPTMKAEAAAIQRACPNCQEHPDPAEAMIVISPEDWRTPYVTFLSKGELPANPQAAAKLQRRVARFCLVNGNLYRRSFRQSLLRCIDSNDQQSVLRAAHEPGHIGGAKLYNHLIQTGYYWPTMENDAAKFVKKCRPCQLHGNLIHAPSVSLHTLSTPYPFHTWAFDLIGKINPPSNRYIWILVATELYTKWVEAIPLRKATGPVVAQFILEHIICRFGIPKVILSDNGTPFVNRDIATLTSKYSIKHHKSTVAYPQGNGQAEATNKTLLKILARMREDYPQGWHEQIPSALWAYRTSSRRPTGFTPFSLVYGAEAILPVELQIPSARLALNPTRSADNRLAQLEILDETRDRAEANFQAYQRQLARAYEGKVHRRTFHEGDLVLKTATAHIRGLHLPKFAPNWEGPFIVRKISNSGYCSISELDSDATFSINCKWIKHYYV